MTNEADFLYATSDVAIWSTCETGIGITASSLATLRPLIRQVFGSKIFGAGSTSERLWTKSALNSKKGGYLRSQSRGGVEEFHLRDDVDKGNGVVTVVGSGADDMELAHGSGRGKFNTNGKSESSRKLKDSESGLADDSSEEFHHERSNEGWEVEVRQTVAQITESR
jgi:hypothetical protein